MVLQFAGPPPPFPGCEGLVSARESGRRLELVIVNFGNVQQEVVESLSPLSWDVLEMNLEDACIEYTRGPKGSFPLDEAESLRAASAAGEEEAAS